MLRLNKIAIRFTFDINILAHDCVAFQCTCRLFGLSLNWVSDDSVHVQ